MPRPKANTGSNSSVLVKKNYAFHKQMVEEMNAVMKETDCTTETELLKRAFRIARDIIRNGGTCFVPTPDGNLKLNF